MIKMYMGNNTYYEESKDEKMHEANADNSSGDARPHCVRGCNPCIRCR